MNQPWIYMCSPSWSPLPPPSLPGSSGSSQCTSPEHLSHASNLGLWSVSPLKIYMFRWCSLKTSHPRLLPQNPSLFCTSVSLFLFCILGNRYHLSKFHIYALVYCNGLYLSVLLHSYFNHIERMKSMTTQKDKPGKYQQNVVLYIQSESCSVESDSLWPHGLSPWNSPGQNTGVGSLSLL